MEKNGSCEYGGKMGLYAYGDDPTMGAQKRSFDCGEMDHGTGDSAMKRSKQNNYSRICVHIFCDGWK